MQYMKRSNSSWKCLVVCVALVGLGSATGCSELVTEGVVTDRETGSPVPDVNIQHQSGSEWKQLGKTDSAGKYWLFKNSVSNAGRIRLNKSGYHMLQMPDSEFMGTSAHVLIPTGHGSEHMEDRRSNRMDEDGESDR